MRVSYSLLKICAIAAGTAFLGYTIGSNNKAELQANLDESVESQRIHLEKDSVHRLVRDNVETYLYYSQRFTAKQKEENYNAWLSTIQRHGDIKDSLVNRQTELAAKKPAIDGSNITAEAKQAFKDDLNNTVSLSQEEDRILDKSARQFKISAIRDLAEAKEVLGEISREGRRLGEPHYEHDQKGNKEKRITYPAFKIN